MVCKIYLGALIISLTGLACKTQPENSSTVLSSLIYSIDYKFKLECSLNGTKSSAFQVKTLQGDTLNFEKLLDHDLLVLRLAQHHCIDCRDMLLELISKRSDSLKSKNFLLLLSSYDPEFPKMVTEKYKLKNIKIGIISEQMIVTSVIEKEDKPYFFFLHKGMKISDTHIPMKGIHKFSETYLDAMITRL